MATLQGKAVKNTYRQVLQIGANNVGVSGSLQPVQDGGGVNTSLSLSTTAATITGTLTINGDLIITGGGIQIQDLIDDTVASLIQNGTGITWAYNDTLRTLTPTITIATADGGVQGDFVQYNTGAGEANAVAKMYWNNTDGTVDLGLIGGNVVLPIGQKQVARVLNNSGSILNKSAYQVVKVSTAQGQRLAVTLAQANNDANSTDTLGLVAENIANNQDGFITTSGVINGIDTTGDLQLEDWNDGDVLYLSPTTPGAITKVKPVAPQHTVIVGFVVYAHKTQGKIYVKVDNGYELDELHNVRITNVANDNILQYNSSLAVWENVAGTTTNIAEGTNLYYTQGRFDSAFAAKSTTNLAEGTNLYFTTARGDANFATNFATKDTDDLPEGSTNLYYTNTRTRNALSVTAGTGIAYNSTTGNFNLGSIPNASLTNSSVTVNGLSLALGASITLTTSNIAEGTNLYWTDARFDSRFGTKTTTDLAEGTNLYYTQARFNTAFDAKTTTDLDEGTNLYYTDARSRAAFSENAVGLDYSSGSGILSLTAGYAIPTTVKLGEYDTAYNRSIVSAAVTGTSTKTLSLTQQDANVVTATWTDQGITTINGTANQIAATTVGNTTTLAFTNDVTMPNNLVVSGNLTINGTATYVNTQSISAKDPLFEVANDNNSTDAVDIGYYGRYYDSAQTRVEFTGLFRDASDAGKFKMFTGLVDEPTNVVDTTGTGYTVGTLVANFEGNLAGTANAANVLSTARTISATGDAAWSVSFDGSANATGALTLANTGVTATTYGTTTAVPTIAVDSKGRITSASNTNIAFPVLTVNSQSGNVVLTTSNIAEGTNQYFTTGRVAAYLTGAISTVLTADLTASRAVASNASGKLVSSATTDTELGYLSGVTSAVQTQLNSKLNLSGGTLTGALAGTTANFSGSIITNVTFAAFNGGSLEIYNTGTTNYFDLKSTGGNFQLRTNVGVSAVNALTIASTGAATFSSSVSIGGANQDYQLDVKKTSTGDSTFDTIANFYKSSTNNTQLLIRAKNSLIDFAGSYIIGGGGPNTALSFSVSPSGGSPTEAMRITSGGLVGIGTSSPKTLLQINGGSGAYPTLGTNVTNSIFVGRNDGLLGMYLGYAADGNGWIQQMRNDSATAGNLILQPSGGNVGIGTSSPTNPLHIVSNTVSQLNVAALSGNTNAQINLEPTGTGVALIGPASAFPLTFRTDATERMRITSGGNVGIGVTPAAWAAPTAGKVIQIGNVASFFSYNNLTNDLGCNIYFNGSDYLYLQTGGASLYRQQSGTHAWFTVGSGTAGNSAGIIERMSISSNGKTTLTGGTANSSDFAIDIKNSNSTMFFVRNDGYMYFGLEANSPYNIAQSGRTCILASNGTVGYLSSTRESKTNIENLSDISWLYQLNPVSFNYRKKDDDNIYTNEAEEEKWYGLIADEVEKVNEDLVFYKTKEDGTKELAGVEYNKLIASLIKSVQELKAEVDELKAK